MVSERATATDQPICRTVKPTQDLNYTGGKAYKNPSGDFLFCFIYIPNLSSRDTKLILKSLLWFNMSCTMVGWAEYVQLPQVENFLCNTDVILYLCQIIKYKTGYFFCLTSGHVIYKGSGKSWHIQDNSLEEIET